MPNVNLVFCEGDSLTAGSQGGVNGDWPFQMDADHPNEFDRINSGSSGATLAVIKLHASAYTVVDTAKMQGGYQNNILVVWIGTNDMAVDGTDGVPLEADLAAYCAARRNNGWKVIVLTAIDRQNAGLPGDFQTQRAAFNAAVVSNWAAYADALVDVAADTRLDDATDTTYFAADKIHLNATGYGVVADLIWPEVDGLLEDPDVEVDEVGFQTIEPLAYPDFRSGWMNQADTALLLDAASEMGALMCQATATDTITKIHFNVRDHTTGATLDVRLETIDNTTGLPSGNLIAVGASGTVTTTGVGRYTCNIGTPPSVTKGDVFAVVIAQPAAASGNCSINGHSLALASSFPTSAQKLGGGAWAFNRSYQMGVLVEYSGGFHAQLHGCPFTVEASRTINTGTTPDERGNKFVFPMAVRISGFTMRTAVATGNMVVKLYDASDNVLATITVDNNNISATTDAVFSYLFSSSIEVAANVVVRLTVQSDSASTIFCRDTTFSSTDDVKGITGAVTVVSTTRKSAGVWTDSALVLTWLGVLIDGLDLAVYPSVNDVENGVVFGGGTGTLVVPAEADVKQGVDYGANGTEFEGEFAGGGGSGGRIIGVNC